MLLGLLVLAATRGDLPAIDALAFGIGLAQAFGVPAGTALMPAGS